MRKILFWLDVNFIHFGIAKYLQEKIDCELYAIFDLNPNLKKNFKNQNFINFKKSWFFWDHVSQNIEKYDIDYLRQIEDKYKINLWYLAFADRTFNNFNYFYKFDRDEILELTEQECRFFEKVLDEINPDFLAMRMPDFHRNYLLTEICKARGIKPLILVEQRLGNRASIVSEITKIDNSWKIEEYPSRSLEEIKEYVKKYDKLKQTKNVESGGINLPSYKKIMPSMEWITRPINKEYKKMYLHYGVTRLNVLKAYSNFELKRRIRKRFIDKNFVKKIHGKEKFVVFALQVQPERNIDFDAPYFSNQLELIFNIAKSLPVEFKLYVKEHHSMKYRGWRSVSEYKKIMDLPNVILLHPSLDPKEVFEKSSLVLTISSTAGFEATLYNKPVIVFADTIYSNIKSVQQVKNLEQLPEIIKKILKTQIDVNGINKFVNIVERNSFDFNLYELNSLIAKQFSNLGFVVNDNITIDELSSFIKEHEDKFEILASEYVKKINQIEAK